MDEQKRTRHNLVRRAAPELDKTIHMGLVKLNDDLNKIMSNTELLSLNDLSKLCDLIKSLATIQKYLPRSYRSANKPKQSTDDADKQPPEPGLLD